MSFRDFPNNHIISLITAFKLKHHNFVENSAAFLVFHHLCAKCSGAHFTVANPAILKVLHELRNAQPVFFFFRLNWNNEMFTLTVCPNIKLIYFDLANSFHLRAKMVLERISYAPAKKINQTVVANSRQQRLFIT